MPVNNRKLSEVHDGLTVADMPGVTPMDKSMNFSLFKRGKLTREYVLAPPKKRAALNGHGNNAVLVHKLRKKVL
jgi:hypothetical protein